MFQFNNLNKLKTLLLSFGILLSSSLFAQSEKTTTESTIVMTQSELDSFLSTIAEARRSQLKERESKMLKEHLNELRTKYREQSEMGNRSSRFRSDDISNSEILRELRYLNQRIDNLRDNNSNRMPSNGRDNSTIIVPGSNTSSVPSYPNRGNTTTVIPKSNNTDDERIADLKTMIDSLKNARNNKPALNTDNTAFADSLNTSNAKLRALKRQMDSLQMKMEEVYDLSKVEKDTERTSYFKEQVFFDNNSEQLRANYFPYIQDVTQVLIKYPEAKVVLEGWASPVGNSNYNKQLSMRRAESVEKALLNNGIDASRIITSFKGEDKSSSEERARRVDMAIILK